MDAKTLEALRGSIAKWKAIVDGTGADEGVYNCPLCKIFYDNDEDNGYECDGCPVQERTGRQYCGGTPYGEWANMNHDDVDFIADTPEKKAAAQAELDFLISLLPPEGE